MSKKGITALLLIFNIIAACFNIWLGFNTDNNLTPFNLITGGFCISAVILLSLSIVFDNED